VAEHWREILAGKPRARLEAILPDYLKRQNWFGGQSRAIKSVTLKETLAVPLTTADAACLVFLQIEYVESNADLYALPLAFAPGNEARRLQHHFPQLVIARLDFTGGKPGGVLYDAMGSPSFGQALLKLVPHRLRLKSELGELEGMRMPALRRILGGVAPPAPVLFKAEQDNSSLVFGDKLILKLFRRLEPGINPELEVSRFLAAKEFAHSPTLAGALEYSGGDDTRFTLAVVHEFLPHARSAWDYTLETLSRYYDRVVAWVAQSHSAPPPPAENIRLLKQDIPSEIAQDIGSYLESARLLGECTGKLHLALAADPKDPAFVPEPFTSQYQRSVFQTMRTVAVQNLRLLRKQLKTLAADLLPLAQRVAEAEPAIIQHYRHFSERQFTARRIRIHGDFHLGQVLWTGKDFAFVDFESDNTLALSERRIKRSPLRDVAGLVRSLHYAAYAGLHQHVERGVIPHENLPRFESWVRHWNQWVSVSCLKGYLHHVGPSGILPAREEDLHAMLRAYLLNHMMIELGRELRPPSSRLKIPLQGILYLVDGQAPPPAADAGAGTANPGAKPPSPGPADG
jgi:maltose alpha-D-glucosyltransferase / alpha-amylase